MNIRKALGIGTLLLAFANPLAEERKLPEGHVNFKLHEVQEGQTLDSIAEEYAALYGGRPDSQIATDFNNLLKQMNGYGLLGSKRGEPAPGSHLVLPSNDGLKYWSSSGPMDPACSTFCFDEGKSYEPVDAPVDVILASYPRDVQEIIMKGNFPAKTVEELLAYTDFIRSYNRLESGSGSVYIGELHYGWTPKKPNRITQQLRLANEIAVKIDGISEEYVHFKLPPQVETAHLGSSNIDGNFPALSVTYVRSEHQADEGSYQYFCGRVEVVPIWSKEEKSVSYKLTDPIERPIDPPLLESTVYE